MVQADDNAEDFYNKNNFHQINQIYELIKNVSFSKYLKCELKMDFTVNLICLL